MNQDEIAAFEMKPLPREVFEPVLQPSCEMEQILGKEFALCFCDLKGTHDFLTCYGDISKIVNALMDYARLLELVCGEWDLQGYHRAVYEYHAGKLREIAGKYQAAIGYDYEAAIKRYLKKRGKQERENDIGEDALVHTLRRNQQEAHQKQNPNEQKR